MSDASASVHGPLKVYEGLIWIGEAPGIRVRYLARSGEDAEAALVAEHGGGHVFTLWNEEDANKLR